MLLNNKPRMVGALDHLNDIRIKMLAFGIFSVWLSSFVYSWIFIEKYDFHRIPQAAVEHQKSCLSDFLNVMEMAKIPLMLFDVEILPRLFKQRPKSWHSSAHECKTLCKYHPENKNVITFAIEEKRFIGKETYVSHLMEELGFQFHLSPAADPRLLAVNKTQPVPTHMWLAKNDHIIHVVILFERLDYVWAAPITDEDWAYMTGVVAPALTGDWRGNDDMLKAPRHAMAFEKSSKFLGLPVTIDSIHRVTVPYHIRWFLKEYRQSKFIECNYEAAFKYQKQYTPVHKIISDANSVDGDFKIKAIKLINKARQVLDGLGIPFWLSSGTCLGWFRQCDIIPYTTDVDFGVWIKDYDERIVEEMERAGLALIHKFGRVNDSFELSFISKAGIKLDIFFFYEGVDHVWNGGTRAHDGRKYKYTFSRFTLCWTEFKGMRVRVPCETKQYILENYGTGWEVPDPKWQWNVSPPNVETNGKWHEDDWDEVIHVYRYNLHDLPDDNAELPGIVREQTTDDKADQQDAKEL